MKSLLLLVLLLSFGQKNVQPATTNQTTNQLYQVAQEVLTKFIDTDSLYAYQSERNWKWGIKNKTGRVVVKPIYASAGAVFNGKFPIIINGYHGIADTSGKINWLKKYRFATYVWEPSGETFISGAGGGLIAVTNKNSKIGFMNYEGELVIPFRYASAQPFSNGLSCVSLNDTLFGYINQKGKTVIPFYYLSANSFHENRAAVLIGNKYGFIDTTGNVVIPARYENVIHFSDGLCAVTKSNVYNDFFFIDNSGKVILKGPYEQTESFRNGKTVISQNGKCWLIDKSGKRLKFLGTDYFAGC